MLLLLLLFVFSLQTSVLAGEVDGTTVMDFGVGSMLRERECTVAFFLGRSAVDLERGRPIFGRSPPTSGILIGGGLSESPLASK